MAFDFEDGLNARANVRFFNKAFYNKRKSEEAAAKAKASGEPAMAVYDQREMIEIRLAGDRDAVHTAPAHEVWKKVEINPGQPLVAVTYAQRFKEQYEAWKAGEEARVNGTPLDVMPSLHDAEIKMLQSVNVFTVEQLAGFSSGAHLGMSGDDWIAKARHFLDVQANRAAHHADAGRMQNLEARAEQAEVKNKALSGILKKMADKLGLTEEDMAEFMDGGGTVQTVEPHQDPGAADLVKDNENGDGGGDNGDGEGEGDGEMTVEEAGPFFGFTASNLREYIKDNTGQAPRGNFSSEKGFQRLLAMAKETAEEVTKQKT